MSKIGSTVLEDTSVPLDAEELVAPENRGTLDTRSGHAQRDFRKSVGRCIECFSGNAPAMTVSQGNSPLMEDSDTYRPFGQWVTGCDPFVGCPQNDRSFNDPIHPADQSIFSLQTMPEAYERQRGRDRATCPACIRAGS